MNNCTVSASKRTKDITSCRQDVLATHSYKCVNKLHKPTERQFNKSYTVNIEEKVWKLTGTTMYNSLSMLVKVYERIRSFIVTCVLCFCQIRQ